MTITCTILLNVYSPLDLLVSSDTTFIYPVPGEDPGINYKRWVGVHKSVNIITKGEGGAQQYSIM